jgi:hypothetical protein
MILIHNGTEVKVVGRYNGSDYEFPPNEDTPCEEDVARHIFGYGEKEKAEALLRLGWILPGQSKEEALKRLAMVRFKKANVKITAA